MIKTNKEILLKNKINEILSYFSNLFKSYFINKCVLFISSIKNSTIYFLTFFKFLTIFLITLRESKIFYLF